MLLNEKNSYDFLVKHLRFPYANFQMLLNRIIEDCGGNIGALAIVDSQFKTKFHRDEGLTEQMLVEYFISPELTYSMDRLFGTRTVLSFKQPIMVDLLYGKGKVITDIDKNKELKKYIKCGILLRHETGTTKFSNGVSRRYFMYKAYPHRAESNPSDALELVIKAISSISAQTLSKSIVDEFPKDAVFQHLMMTGLATNLISATNVYPEHSVIIGTVEKIEGRLDFFINSDLSWGIELLIKGRNFKEHQERFFENGKYADLGCKEYVLADFREPFIRQRKKMNRKKNVITVVFKNSQYESVICYLPDGSERHVLLSP